MGTLISVVTAFALLTVAFHHRFWCPDCRHYTVRHDYEPRGWDKPITKIRTCYRCGFREKKPAGGSWERVDNEAGRAA